MRTGSSSAAPELGYCRPELLRGPDGDRWGQAVTDPMSRVDPDQPAQHVEPESSVARRHHGRDGAQLDRRPRHAIQVIDHVTANRMGRIACSALELRRGNVGNSRCTIDPDRTIGCDRYSGDSPEHARGAENRHENAHRRIVLALHPPRSKHLRVPGVSR